jgi:putative oxidoreductase
MRELLCRSHSLLNSSRQLDFLAPLALRFYLAPVFWFAGTNKMAHMDDTIAWFGNSEWGLGLPFPELMAWLAVSTEIGGAVLLALGLGVRLITIPLMITMVVAAVTVHWEHGWQAINDLKSPWASASADEALRRLDITKDILREHGNYSWLTEHGSLVSLNNGIEWAATYFIMCLALFFTGAGKWISVDDWIARCLKRREGKR